MFSEKRIGRWDYEELVSCPFCGGRGLSSLESDDCAHFVVAFQEGVWDPTICPPVSCNGFLFSHNALKDDLRKFASDAGHVVCRVKPGTPRHPKIEAYFCDDPAVACEIRATHKKIPSIRVGIRCPECGQLATVIGEADDLLCALCGAYEEPSTPISLWIN